MADLNSLAIFAKVVETRSFTEASRRLNMPVSTVSRRVSDLENQLGIRLLDRSTRKLRLTKVGLQILEHARRTAEIGEAVENVAASRTASVSGVLRLSAPPSISNALLPPLIGAFQSSYPEVRVQALVASREIDHIAEHVDLSFCLGPVRSSSLTARRLLRYRHQLVASPGYLRLNTSPRCPRDLLQHRILAYSDSKSDVHWPFHRTDGPETETLTVRPHLLMNDFAGLATALMAVGGISELSPVVLPELLRDGRLVEVMQDWRFPSLDLSVLHLDGRHVTRAVRAFKDFAIQMTPTLFPSLPN